MKKSVFTVTLFIDHEEISTGQGSSKKEAEQEAASKAWLKLNDLNSLLH